MSSRGGGGNGEDGGVGGGGCVDDFKGGGCGLVVVTVVGDDDTGGVGLTKVGVDLVAEELEIVVEGGTVTVSRLPCVDGGRRGAGVGGCLGVAVSEATPEAEGRRLGTITGRGFGVGVGVGLEDESATASATPFIVSDSATPSPSA